MSKKKVFVIVVCLIVAAVGTLLINVQGNKKYNEVSKTVKVWSAAQYVPMGQSLTAENVKQIDVPAQLAGQLKLVTEDVTGKTLLIALLPGHLIQQNEMSSANNTHDGYIKIGLQTTQSSSDQVMSGARVDIYPTDQVGAPLEPLVRDVYVVASYDQTGRIISPVEEKVLGNVQNKIPAMVEVEVQEIDVPKVVAYAAAKRIYLVRR